MTGSMVQAFRRTPWRGETVSMFPVEKIELKVDKEMRNLIEEQRIVMAGWN